MTPRTLLWPSLLICALSTHCVSLASPVAYSEAVAGDLSNAGALTNLALDVGANTVSGSFGTASPGNADFDSFAFTIAAGTQLVSLQISISDAIGNITNSNWLVFSGSADYAQGTAIGSLSSLSPGTAMFGGSPLGSGLYNVSHTSFSSTGRPAFSDFVFTMNVQSVNGIPEPDTLLLTVAALLSTAKAARRRPSA